MVKIMHLKKAILCLLLDWLSLLCTLLLRPIFLPLCILYRHAQTPTPGDLHVYTYYMVRPTILGVANLHMCLFHLE